MSTDVSTAKCSDNLTLKTVEINQTYVNNGIQISKRKQKNKKKQDITRQVVNNLNETNSKASTTEDQNDQCLTPKTQTHSTSDVRRWASVVKAKKSLMLTTESNLFGDRSDNVHITPEIFECVFKTFPNSLANHKGFISCNQNIFVCNVCSTDLESVFCLSNHLNTRKHEDNVITFLKQKIPPSLHHILEFISFYRSNLYCNLCQCQIDLLSQNPYKTVVNIIAHNTSTNHAYRKTRQETYNEAVNLLRSLASIYPEIKENMRFIEKKMCPQFRCQLCNYNILYSENENTFAQALMSHLKSTCHVKNQRAVEILKLFGEERIISNDNFTVENGNISCIHCNQYIETDIDKIISHVNGVEHTTNLLGQVNLSPSILNYSEHNSIQEENVLNEEKDISIMQKIDKSSDEKCKLKLDDLLKSSKNCDNTNCLVENEKGGVTCVVCDTTFPLNVSNIQTHLNGSIHAKNKMKMSEEVSPSEKNTGKVKESLKQNCEENVWETITPEIIRDDQLLDIFENVIDRRDKNNTGQIICLLCQRSLNPNMIQVQNHFLTNEHKENVLTCLLGCPVCSRKGFSKCKKMSLKDLKIPRCLSRKILPILTQEHVFNSLVKKNPFVYENRQYIETNIDGIHVYCNMCKTLIPLAIDLDLFEQNMIQHLQGNRHNSNLLISKSNKTDHIVTESEHNGSIPTKIQLSINEQKENNETRMEEKLTVFLHKSEIVNSPEKCGTTETLALRVIKGGYTPAKNILKLFKAPCEPMEVKVISKIEDSKSLPVNKSTCLITFKEETNEDTLKRRGKQISYGQNTLSYSHYLKKVPKHKRCAWHPVTPPKYLKCSRRTWDGMVRVWRKKLHDWDPPASISESLDKDIKPLPPQHHVFVN